MSFRSVLIITVALIGPVTPQAGTAAAADVVLVSEFDVIPDDLYAAGLVVDVRGVIDGDLVAAASERIVVSGTVEGDVLAIAPTVEIAGQVTGSVRALANTVVVSGTVGEDVVVAVRRGSIVGMVGGDVMALVDDVDVSGAVGRDLQVQSWGTVTVAGQVGRDLEVNGSELSVTSTARIDGDVRYRGSASLSENAEIGGSTLALGDVPVPLRARALVLVGLLMAGLLVVVGGLVIFWMAPRSAEAAVRAARKWPWAFVVGVGSLALPVLLVIGVVAAMSAASPDLTGVAILATSPILLAYAGFVALMAILGFVPSAATVGRVLTRGRVPAVGGFLIGLMVMTVLLFVPVVGSWLLILMWLVGIGAWVMGAWAARAETLA